MKRMFRLTAALAAVAMSWCASALAAPTTVQLRVEGATTTLFEGPVTTDGKVITKGGNTLACDGTIDPSNPGPGPTMTSTLDDGSIAGGFDWDATFFNDFFVSRIGPDANADPRYWGYALNFVPVNVGGCQQQVKAGDEVVYAYDFFAPDFSSKPLLRLAGPPTAVPGQTVGVKVTNGGDGQPVQGAAVAGASTAADGSVTVSFDSPGLKVLKAEKAGAIRSNVLRLCVSADAAGTCGLPVSQLGGSSAGGKPGQARDSKAPAARITGPVNGRRYKRGPRLLRGSAVDDGSGVSVVKLALRRKVAGRPCQWWSGRRERFVGTHCRKVFFFGIGDDASWSYQLARALPPGRYVLDVKAFDKARNRDERFVTGSNRVEFEVLSRGGKPAAKAARSAKGVSVDVMVVGKNGTLVGAREVRARAARVRVGGRRCRVSASTPLAALASVLRGSTLTYKLLDFGRCSARGSGSSAQLFVDRLGGERNAGEDGWVYKVGDRAGTAGAADPAGPFGAGRLRTGDRVLWFYCRLQASGRGCQRTLRLLPPKASPRAGTPLSISVRSYDNEGSGRAETGATVRLGSSVSTSDLGGIVSLTPPGDGSFRLEATKAGTVPAFPLRLGVSGV